MTEEAVLARARSDRRELVLPESAELHVSGERLLRFARNDKESCRREGERSDRREPVLPKSAKLHVSGMRLRRFARNDRRSCRREGA